MRRTRIRRESLTVLSCACVIVLFLSGCHRPGGSFGQRNKNAILTEESAIERVVQTLGLPGEQLRATASRVTLTEQVVPFIESSLTQDAWRIDLDNVTLMGRDGERTFPNPFVKSLSVWVSSQTGQVMKVASPDIEGDPFPSMQVQERLVGVSIVFFSGLPKTAPKSTLAEVLQKGNGSAHIAKQIVAYYVAEKRTEPKPEEKAVWAVFSWGLPPMGTVGPALGPDYDYTSTQDSLPLFITHHYDTFRAEPRQDTP